MVDVVDVQTRSRMMAGIKGKNTRPEMMIRKALHRLGYRYRLHSQTLPGKPDLIFPKFGAVIFVHGCFWHGHDCALFKWPSSRAKFWREKIEGNRSRDAKSSLKISESGWRILTIWECAIKGPTRRTQEEIVNVVVSWLETGVSNLELRGINHRGNR